MDLNSLLFFLLHLRLTLSITFFHFLTFSVHPISISKSVNMQLIIHKIHPKTPHHSKSKPPAPKSINPPPFTKDKIFNFFPTTYQKRPLILPYLRYALSLLIPTRQISFVYAKVSNRIKSQSPQIIGADT